MESLQERLGMHAMPVLSAAHLVEQDMRERERDRARS
jgi:hypothetical protein